jgi:thymidylate kinase
MAIGDSRWRAEIFERLTNAWDDRGLCYSVTHGIEGFPTSAGRDLDLLASEETAKAAIGVAEDVLQREGFTTARPSPIWGHRLIAVGRPGWSIALEIHFSTDLRWKGVTLAATPCPSRRVGPFWVDGWAGWVKRVLLPVLAGDTARFLRRYADLHMTEWEAPVVRDKLPSHLGAKLYEEAWVAFATPDLQAIIRLTPRLRHHLITHAATHAPWSLFGGTMRSAGRALRRLGSPSAPVVALVGPDGVGKSTVARSLREGSRSLFTGIEVRHWRPRILPRLGAFVGQREPPASEAVIPRREPGRFEIIRLVYYGLDYMLGYWLRDRPATSRQRLVVYDRHAADMSVDPLRYGLRSRRRAGGLYQFVPKPDLTILIDGDPDMILRGKAELEPQEIRAQLERWRTLAAHGVVDAVVERGSDPQEVAERVRQLIIDATLTIIDPKCSRSH